MTSKAGKQCVKAEQAVCREIRVRIGWYGLPLSVQCTRALRVSFTVVVRALSRRLTGCIVCTLFPSGKVVARGGVMFGGEGLGLLFWEGRRWMPMPWGSLFLECTSGSLPFLFPRTAQLFVGS